MPDIRELKASLEKKVDMNKFFGKDAYVIIKKLKKSSKKMIQLLAVDSTLSKIALQIAKENDLGKGTEVNNYNIGKLYMDLSIEQRMEAENVAEKIEAIYINEGVDQENHNLTDDGKQIVLNVEFWELFPEAALFIIEKIKDFNSALTDYSLGELKGNKSIM